VNTSSPVQEVLSVPHLPPCAGAGQHIKLDFQTHRTPKAIARSSTRSHYHYMDRWTVVSVADTLHNRSHFLRNSCSTQGAKPPPGTPMHGSHLLVQHGGRRSGFLPFNDAHLDDRKHPILARRPLRVIVCAHQGRGPRVRANINQSVQNGTCRRSAPRGPAPQHAPRTTARTARAPRLRTARRQPDTAANTKAQRRCFVR
jgi:hypothetical protein